MTMTTGFVWSAQSYIEITKLDIKVHVKCKSLNCKILNIEVNVKLKQTLEKIQITEK